MLSFDSISNTAASSNIVRFIMSYEKIYTYNIDCNRFLKNFSVRVNNITL